jgi:hypothetical protein
MSAGADALEAIDRILDRGGDADDILRAVVDALVERAGCAWAGILFVEGNDLVLGPQAGEPDPGLRVQLPVAYEDARVAELVVDGCEDTAFLERVAQLISPYCLVGWDTAGEPWNP